MTFVVYNVLNGVKRFNTSGVLDGLNVRECGEGSFNPFQGLDGSDHLLKIFWIRGCIISPLWYHCRRG